MKRYDLTCTYDGGGMGDEEESVMGDYVRYEDAIAAVLAEREACAKIAENFDFNVRPEIDPPRSLPRYVAQSIRTTASQEYIMGGPDCRTCMHFGVLKFECFSVAACISGSTYKPSHPIYLWRSR